MRYHLKERFLTIKDDFVVRNDRKDIVFDVKECDIMRIKLEHYTW